MYTVICHRVYHSRHRPPLLLRADRQIRVLCPLAVENGELMFPSEQA